MNSYWNSNKSTGFRQSGAKSSRLDAANVLALYPYLNKMFIK